MFKKRFNAPDAHSKGRGRKTFYAVVTAVAALALATTAGFAYAETGAGQMGYERCQLSYLTPTAPEGGQTFGLPDVSGAGVDDGQTLPIAEQPVSGVYVSCDVVNNTAGMVDFDLFVEAHDGPSGETCWEDYADLEPIPAGERLTLVVETEDSTCTQVGEFWVGRLATAV